MSLNFARLEQMRQIVDPLLDDGAWHQRDDDAGGQRDLRAQQATRARQTLPVHAAQIIRNASTRLLLDPSVTVVQRHDVVEPLIHGAGGRLTPRVAAQPIFHGADRRIRVGAGRHHLNARAEANAHRIVHALAAAAT